MKLCSRILAVAVIAVTSFSLISCAGPAGYSYQNVSIQISAQCLNCPNGIIYNPAYPVPSLTGAVYGGPAPAGSVLLMVGSGGPGGLMTFNAQVTNAPPNITWNLYPSPDLVNITTLPTGTGTPVGESGAAYGVLNTQSGTTTYLTIATYPIYSGAALTQANAMGIPQGDILVTASVPSDPNNPSSVVTARQLVQMFDPSGICNTCLTLIPKTPTNPASLTTPVATVPRNGTFQFTGFAVGSPPCSSTAACNAIYQGAPINSTDNGVVWLVANGNSTSGGIGTATVGGLVNGVPGPYGTITQTGLYTAPPIIPPSGNPPLIVLESHASPSLTATAYLAIN